jgi:DNA-binding transcriptional regulator YiaG
MGGQAMTARREFSLKGEPPLDEPFHYTLCGLPDVYLLNGVIFHDDDGYGPSFEIQDLDGLHDAIAAHIVERADELMTGPELRFLRKRMHRTQTGLAELLRVSEQTVANYEKGATAVTGPADFSMRILYLLHVLPPDAGKAMLDKLTRALTEREKSRSHIIPLHTGWDEARIAA